MKVSKMQWKEKTGWNTKQQDDSVKDADVILCFGGRTVFENMDKFDTLRKNNPKAEIVYSSTAGEIFDIDVFDNSVSVILMKFDHTPIKTVKRSIKNYKNSEEVGKAIIEELNAPDLNHVFILSDGQLVNGSDLLTGVRGIKNENTIVTGGLAGDGYQFDKALVGLNGQPEEGDVVAIGYYGDRLKVGFGCRAGWDTMTTDRLVTKSEKNVLYEVDGQSALSLYKNYLGDVASELPGSALYYPLSLSSKSNQEKPVIRTILGINEEDQSMTFAGNIPQGYNVKLMKHNPDRLISEAGLASQRAISTFGSKKPDLALIISCVGRKIVLGQHVDEEVEEAKNILGNDSIISGFYSYGEIGPKNNGVDCDLHNQTIAITTYLEM